MSLVIIPSIADEITQTSIANYCTKQTTSVALYYDIEITAIALQQSII
jgi:hypothetical protein